MYGVVAPELYVLMSGVVKSTVLKPATLKPAASKVVASTMFVFAGKSSRRKGASRGMDVTGKEPSELTASDEASGKSCSIGMSNGAPLSMVMPL